MPNTDPITGYDYTDVEDYSMYSTLIHEMGHILGFFHSDGNDDDGNNCDHSGSIMKSSLKAGQDVPLTNDDICQFKILYCCSLESDVEKFNLINEFYSYPNPATDYIEISYPLAEKRGTESAFIFDILGIEQSTPVNIVDTPANRGQVRVDVSNLAPGVYFVRVWNVILKFVKY
jgi:hypothetical protein